MDFSRQEQLDSIGAEAKRHADFGLAIQAAKRTQAAQVSHLAGVYSEVDKLTKGKSLVPTSDLLVEVVNSLISDAKALVYRDTYLDRLKTFVPAGDNPRYPDVLVALRILQQTLTRFQSMLESETATHSEAGEQIHTVLGALEIAKADEQKFYEATPANLGESTTDEEDGDDSEEEDLEEGNETDDSEDDDDEASEEDDDDLDDEDDDNSNVYEETVWKDELRPKLERRTVSAVWFRSNRDGDSYFDFKKLDAKGIPHYSPPAEGITFVAGSE